MHSLVQIQETSRSGRLEEAGIMLRQFLSDLFPLAIESVEVRADALSLNSVNGFIHLSTPDPKSGASVLFFKFHHEENEDIIKEYYNSQLLEENGYPIEMPVYASHEVGKQVLLYPFKKSERMADVCKRLDTSNSDTLMQSVVDAQEKLDALCCERYLATLHQATPDQLKDEPVLQLFYHRLVDANGQPGGRFAQFYENKVFEFPGQHIFRYEDLASFTWHINGIEYQGNLAESFAQARKLLSPEAHGTYTAVVAHGDAHNGNVWFNEGTPPALSFFDPAFAGPHIPALLAEIKATFHNIFAHPLWLYDSQEADAKFDITFAIHGRHIDVEHNWQISRLRQQFLQSKLNRLWKPLIGELSKRKLLPGNWQEYMRSALFCCPTLVMNLRANAGNARNFHTPKTSLLGLSVAMSLASSPVAGHDTVSDFFDELRAL